jgi:hypothetical protein
MEFCFSILLDRPGDCDVDTAPWNAGMCAWEDDRTIWFIAAHWKYTIMVGILLQDTDIAPMFLFFSFLFFSICGRNSQ